MYNVARNNFYHAAKNNCIYTPSALSDFIFRLIADKIPRESILDPCVGKGSLLRPFQEAGFHTIGIDIEDQGFPHTHCRNFIEVQIGEFENPALVIVNPPFNLDATSKTQVAKHYGRRPLLPEVWLQKIIELWGKTLPIVLFSPYGLRLNQSLHSRRWMRFVDGSYPPISSIIALPKDIYENVLFHSEVLIFNITGLAGHYFYHPQA